jgi:hypothetical protein
MHVVLNSGMASKYFVTNPEKAVEEIQDPGLLISRSRLTVPVLAGFLGFLSGKPAAGSKESRPPAQVALKMLETINIDHRWPAPADCVAMPNALVVIANTFDEGVVHALKIMKLRGVCLGLAVDISKSMSSNLPRLIEGLIQDDARKHGFFETDDRSCIGFGLVEGLTVVSGLAMTVFATGTTCEEILRTHPGLAGNMADAGDEPID